MDCEVQMVQGSDADSPTHPNGSTEVTDEDATIPVTLYSYQRCKYRLYSIISPILENVRFFYGTNKSQVAEKIENVHQQLLSWSASLPPVLKLSGNEELSRAASFSLENTFRLQALALQLAYDNIMIVLHRPLLLAETNMNLRTTRDGTSSLKTAQSVAEAVRRGVLVSKNQCWESALRTSEVVDHMDILGVAKATHAASYVGMHMFTAGIVLSVVGLSQPTSSEAQKAKKSIGSITRLLSAFGPFTLLSAQSGSVLQTMLKLIMRREMEELLYGPEHARKGRIWSENIDFTAATKFGTTQDHYRDGAEDTTQNTNLVAGPYPRLCTGSSMDKSDVMANLQGHPIPLSSTAAGLHKGLRPAQQAVASLPYSDSTDGHGLASCTNPAERPSTNLSSYQTEVAVLHEDADGVSSMYNDLFGGLEDNGQIWLWDTESWPS
ncbi:uncharacterized protein AB675_7384 [Cyphellophora attinorum]|uniref:Transcription factor domain-containing protein n=1 Tax=Cyphellophora attinorum TaxID=1664694 RepID=A0A0N0NIY8_9EURO|nr:uncharacterized protein AB675_7384 [Phialophora attinorum]KPI36298.1 hypothetical protein AB675_7384 [Phialophora attinorum]